MSRAALWAMLAVTLPAMVLVMLAVARGWTHAIDARLLAKLPRARRWSAQEKPPRLIAAANDLTALGGDTLRLLLLLCCAIGLAADGRAPTAIVLIAIFAAARVALLVLKLAVRRPRPDVAGHHVPTYTTSFPSGHTFMAAVLMLAAALLVPLGQPAAFDVAMAVLAMIVSLLVGSTRLLLGVHWPSDILAGWLAGIAWAAGCVLLVGALA